ncbi:MAG: ABC transporter ATP-binding protein [Alicyclobacillus sp.]|nr:ABC transporter ATP-binding protein [Alicyclobacillus sp.]
MAQSKRDDGSQGILVSHVYRQFGKKQVLHDIGLHVWQGEIFGLLGPSGSGKTTLVKLMAGIDEPTSGEVVVNGVRLPKLKMFSKIGYMAQADALYAELTAKENLQFFASLYGLDRRQRHRRIQDVAELVQLTHALNTVVSAFSGGMKRRLSLAIALLNQPEVLILDEPTVGLDPVLRMSIWKELRRLRDLGTTIVVTTHVMDEADKCDRLGMLRDGKIIGVGTPEELKRQTQASTIEEAFLAYGGVNA